MFIRDLKDCEEFMSADEAVLRELLHPDKADLKIGYSLAHAVVKPGDTTVTHRLKSAEVYYVLSGDGEMSIDNEIASVCQHQAIYIPPGSVQKIKNTGYDDLVFLCIVDPAWKPEDEEVLE